MAGRATETAELAPVAFNRYPERAVISDADEIDEAQLAEAAVRLKQGRLHLAMTVYTIQHRRRTPDQVREVLDRAARAIRRNQLVRLRRQQHRGVH
jgi:hypothetical protein